MPRPQLRLATLALLIVIIALAAALLAQRRRETALNSRVQALEEEIAWNRLSSHRREAFQERQLNELRSQTAHTPKDGQDTSRNRPIDQRETVEPKE
jgi:hypothetical protein